jgi:ABC-type transport system involved in cytochrome bd biosynthesis fused ATPase/permease subunit
MVSKALEWASVSIGAPLLGNMEGCSFVRAFGIKRYVKRYVERYVKCPVSRYHSL